MMKLTFEYHSQCPPTVLNNRKELFTKLHFFVHLNLAIALLLGYVVFIAGVDTAVVNRVSSRDY